VNRTLGSVLLVGLLALSFFAVDRLGKRREGGGGASGGDAPPRGSGGTDHEAPLAREPASPAAEMPAQLAAPRGVPGAQLPPARPQFYGELSSRAAPAPGALAGASSHVPGAVLTPALEERLPGGFAPAAPGGAGALAESIALAEAAFQAGDSHRGVRLLRGVFVQGKNRGDVNLTPQVLALLDFDADPAARKEYLAYLTARGGGERALDEFLTRAGKLAASEDPLDVRRAWAEMSAAYDVAADARQRRSVLDVLEPFIQQMVFSGRYTPLLETHTVQPGEYLGMVAAKFHTTSDALMRLNGLRSENVIQPRTRLRALSGKVAIFVDKSDFRLWLTVDGKVLLERAVGLGRDNATPSGRFEISVRQKDPTWYRSGESPVPPGDPRNVLGSRWLGFRDTPEHSGFGIHGTDDPSSIGRESSAGCIRLTNADIELIYDFVPRGTVVVVRE
jgi:lipoprotein-anchoring transpeptidase ErfK/SrfK